MLFITHSPSCPLSFFFNDTATTEIYTLSLHDALPILARGDAGALANPRVAGVDELRQLVVGHAFCRKRGTGTLEDRTDQLAAPTTPFLRSLCSRSEERRVGKECRSRW